jgi:hypothetical protein
VRLLLAVWAAGLLATPTLSHAQMDFESVISGVRQHFENRQYEQALGQLTAAKQRARAPEQKLVVALYEGLLLASLGPRHQPAATEAFKQALRLSPTVRLPLKVPPRIARMFEAIRTQVQAEQHARSLLAPPLSAGKADTGVFRTSAITSSLTGVGLLISGGVFWNLAKREQSRLRSSDPGDDPDIIAARGKTYQTLGLGLLGTGLVGLGTAATLSVLSKPRASFSLELGMGRSSLVVHGRWP